MRYLISTLFVTVLFLLVGFRVKKSDNISIEKPVATINSTDIIEIKDDALQYVATTTQASDFVKYAKTLIGTPYLYGSTDLSKGLDCSGFVNAVSNHFGIKVPRSSVDFTNFAPSIETSNAQPGDLILFTGTDPNKRIVGHIGIITDNNNGQVQFIHSSSGKANRVTISDLDGYYETRFIKVIRIFPTGNKA